ncbi:MAG: hypothetical protein HY782_05270 [Chloroflexi bacterium]|nr:hypothetical protein [Chloroflexota bacterium]
MSKQKTGASKNQIWIEVQKRYHLSDMHIQMAKELGLNPKKFGGLANTKQEPWKAPLPDFIEAIYFKRFRKTRPAERKPAEPVKSKEPQETETHTSQDE